MKQYFVVLFLIISACLAGCGSGKSGSQSMEEGDMGENGGENPVYEENNFDWYSQSFARNDEVEEASVLGTEASGILTLDGGEGAAENPDCFYGTDGTSFYALECSNQLSPDMAVSLVVCDAADGSRRIALPLEEWGTAPDSLYITAAFLKSRDGFAVQAVSLGLNEQKKIYPEQYRILCMDWQGEILSNVDLQPIYEAAGMIEEGTMNPVADCAFDGAGNLYARKGNILVIADCEGGLLTEKTYGDEIHTSIEDPIPCGEGLLYPIRDSEAKTVRLVWFDPREGKEYEKGELEYSDFQKLYALQGGHLYYGTLAGIVDWDIVSGDRYMIF